MQGKDSRDESEPRPTSVYRIYDAAGVLIYVGVTHRSHVRQEEHLHSKPWAQEIAETHWEHLPSRGKALAREAELISAHHPRYNIQGKSGDGEPTQIEFRLRAQQYDLMIQVHHEMQEMHTEWVRFKSWWEPRWKMLNHIHHYLHVALRDKRPLYEHEMGKVAKVLRQLEHQRAKEKKTRRNSVVEAQESDAA